MTGVVNVIVQVGIGLLLPPQRHGVDSPSEQPVQGGPFPQLRVPATPSYMLLLDGSNCDDPEERSVAHKGSDGGEGGGDGGEGGNNGDGGGGLTGGSCGGPPGEGIGHEVMTFVMLGQQSVCMLFRRV